jgi:hypothetical protein
MDSFLDRCQALTSFDTHRTCLAMPAVANSQQQRTRPGHNGIRSRSHPIIRAEKKVMINGSNK